MSQLKIKNGNSWESIPAGGIGVPSGGTTGQVLQKSSNTDYATEWATQTHGLITEVIYDHQTPSNGAKTLSKSVSEFDALLIETGWGNGNGHGTFILKETFLTQSINHSAVIGSANSLNAWVVFDISFSGASATISNFRYNTWVVTNCLTITGMKFV